MLPPSLRSKRFRLVLEQRKTRNGIFGFGRARPYLSSPLPPRSFNRTIFHAVFDSRFSFFAPKPQGNACYEG